MPTLSELVAFLDALLDHKDYPDEQNTPFRTTKRTVHRIGLVLDAVPSLPEWVVSNNMDALFIHRPWKLNSALLPAEVGILTSHLPFDEHLTIGYNPWLAQDLGIHPYVPFGEKQGRPLGMIGKCPLVSTSELVLNLKNIFQDVDEVISGGTVLHDTLAVVGAMTDHLLREANNANATLYITGQMRQPGRHAVADCGMAVVAVGHHRSEYHGLTTLAHILKREWPSLECVTYGQKGV